MKSEITISEIYQTSTTTKPNQWQCTVVAIGDRENVRDYSQRIGLLPLSRDIKPMRCLASPCPCTAVKTNQCHDWCRFYPPTQ